MADNKLTSFPVGNGDTTLIEFEGTTVLTDINYRAKAEDDEEYYDIAPEIRTACLIAKADYRLDLFVLTHPDKDHLGGFERMFYTGDPTAYGSRPKEKEDLILIKEIWISPYSENPHYETDASKPVFKEIRRRKALQGATAGEKDGNRLQVLTADSGKTEGTLVKNLQWKVLAPTSTEADIPEGEKDKPTSANNASLAIRWSAAIDGKPNRILLGGDAEVEIWERIWKDYKSKKEELSWHVLLAPHHCSRGSMARKNQDDAYEYSGDALDALGQVMDDGFVLSSSKEIKNDDDNPPSWDARKKYLKILKDAEPSGHEDRFLNPDTSNKGEPFPVVFNLTKTGPRLKTAGTGTAKASAAGAASASPIYG